MLTGPIRLSFPPNGPFPPPGSCPIIKRGSPNSTFPYLVAQGIRTRYPPKGSSTEAQYEGSPAAQYTSSPDLVPGAAQGSCESSPEGCICTTSQPPNAATLILAGFCCSKHTAGPPSIHPPIHSFTLSHTPVLPSFLQPSGWRGRQCKSTTIRVVSFV